MAAPIAFCRTETLLAPAGSLTLAGLPQNAAHLLLVVRARSDNQTATGLFLGLRPNSEIGPNTYDGNVLRFVSATAGGQADDGIDLEQWVLGDLTPSDVQAGVYGSHFGVIPRYSSAEPHVLLQMGFSRPDDLATTDANFAAYLGGGQHVPAVAAAVSSLQLVPEVGNLAAGSSITALGLLEAGDASLFARTPQVGTVLDFAGAAFKDVTLTAGVNALTATNPRLGRTLHLRLTGGDGTTSLTLPPGTEKLADTFVPGATAWVAITCTDEAGPGFIASVRDVVP